MDWKFFDYRDGETRTNSPSEKYFKSLEINESLIRELIQNSMDAVDDKKNPIEVKISFKELEFKKCERYFKNLREHYEACNDYDIEDFPKNDKKVKFLVLEDFNTIGLEKDGEKDFFEKDNIRSDSNAQGGGSHGIGKIVFYIASQIKTLFGYSIYENGHVFRAAADFQTHKIGEIVYTEYGHLKLDQENDKDFIKEIFTRSDKKGLSIAIPLPDETINIDNLKEAIVAEYYYPIINEKLIVHLENIIINEKLIVHLENIIINDEFILNQDKPKTKLISEFITGDKDKTLKIAIGNQYEKPQKFKLKENDEKQIISAFSNEGDKFIFIKFTFNIPWQDTSKPPEEGYLYLLIQKIQENSENKEALHFDFWRGNLLIKDASKKNSASSEYNVVVLIDGNELSALLRKLENPSHTKWEYSRLSKEIKDNYKYITQLVPFITRLPNEIIKLVKNQYIELDNNFFSDYFPDSNSLGNKNNKEGKAKKSEQANISPFDSISANFYYRENRKENGFILSLSDKGKQQNISEVTINVAYGTNKGDPFKNYNKKDFDLKENIKPTLTNGEVLTKDGNQIVCRVKKEEDFKISISGFDPDRELKVDIKESL